MLKELIETEKTITRNIKIMKEKILTSKGKNIVKIVDQPPISLV